MNQIPLYEDEPSTTQRRSSISFSNAEDYSGPRFPKEALTVDIKAYQELDLEDEDILATPTAADFNDELIEQMLTSIQNRDINFFTQFQDLVEQFSFGDRHQIGNRILTILRNKPRSKYEPYTMHESLVVTLVSLFCF